MRGVKISGVVGWGVDISGVEGWVGGVEISGGRGVGNFYKIKRTELFANEIQFFEKLFLEKISARGDAY